MSTEKKAAKAIKQGAKTTSKVLLKSLKWMLIIIIIGGFFAGGAALGYVGALVKDEPIRDEQTIKTTMNQNTESSFAYFNDGTLIGQFRTDVNRRLIDLKEIPDVVIDALLAVEDNDFREHVGIDLSGLLRAVKQRVLNEPVQTGGSTITQQVARNVFLTTAREDGRKAKEIFLAMRIERYLSKDEILQAYLNKVSFGNGSSGYSVYGIRSATEGIFDITDLNELSIAQAAYLVGLPQAPSIYSAFDGKGNFNERGFTEAMKRQRHVLKRMLDSGRITRAEYEDALDFDVKATLSEKKPKAYNTYPYLMIELEQRAAEALVLAENPRMTKEELKSAEAKEMIRQMKEQLSYGGFHIHTTIDKKLYDGMQKIAQNPDYFAPDDVPDSQAEDGVKGVEQIGAIMLDNKTGAIIALMEGRGFHIEQMNHAVQMQRQPGSTMKPISAYLPAIESGAIQPASTLDDVPLVLEDGSKGYHIPLNWNVKFHGIMTARQALNQSYNVPALWLFNETIGIEEAWEFTRKLGITTLTERDMQARTGVIGGLEYGTTVEELTNAYSTIANEGQYRDTFMISKIENSHGEPIYAHAVETDTVFSEETAYLMTDMMRTVITSGTGTSIMDTFKYYGEVPIVGKTGSTQLDRDAWFIGYSPDVTVGVWAGYDKNYTLTLQLDGPQRDGRQRAKNIWSHIMNAAVELRPELFETTEFTRPDGIVERTVSSVSGMLPSELVEKSGLTVTDLFDRKKIPTEVDDVLVEMEVVEVNGRNYIPNRSTPKDLIQKKVLIHRPYPLYDILDDIQNKLENTPDEQKPRVHGRPARLSDYYPADLLETAPVETDPREDDGKAPEPPTDLEIEKLDNVIRITFEPSTSKNLIAHQLYRSINGEPFQLQTTLTSGRSVTDYYSPDNDYAYYVVAVNFAGNMSEPSEIIYSGDDIDDLFPTPTKPSVPDQDKNDDDDDKQDETRVDNEQDDSNASDETDALTASDSPPHTPQNVSVREDSGLFVEISWDANDDDRQVMHYVVYYARSEDDEYRSIGSTAATSYKYIAVPAEGWYAVAAVNEQGESEMSPPVHLTAEQ